MKVFHESSSVIQDHTIPSSIYFQVSLSSIPPAWKDVKNCYLQSQLPVLFSEQASRDLWCHQCSSVSAPLFRDGVYHYPDGWTEKRCIFRIVLREQLLEISSLETVYWQQVCCCDMRYCIKAQSCH